MISFTTIAQRGGDTLWTKYRHEVSAGYGVNNLFATLGERDNLGVKYILQRSTFNGLYRYYFSKKTLLFAAVLAMLT